MQYGLFRSSLVVKREIYSKEQTFVPTKSNFHRSEEKIFVEQFLLDSNINTKRPKDKHAPKEIN